MVFASRAEFEELALASTIPMFARQELVRATIQRSWEAAYTMMLMQNPALAR
jgi:hypothetical protein